MGNRIQPENNRTFKTGPGDWIGPLVWHGDILDFHQGYITVPVLGGGQIVTVSLRYPHIKPAPGVINGFGGAQITTIFPTLGRLQFTWLITDGIYIDWTRTEGSNFNQWMSLGDAYNVPQDWNVEDTVFTISMGNPTGDNGEIGFDDFDLTPYTKAAQYLPILGVG
jgi:hypothetical protein